MPVYDIQPCLADNLLSPWTDWSECDAVCGSIGTRNRTRVCGNDVFTEIEEAECTGDNCEPTCPYAYYSVCNTTQTHTEMRPVSRELYSKRTGIACSCNCKFILILKNSFSFIT